eukprot:5510660-Amphidinium_carterae.1
MGAASCAQCSCPRDTNGATVVQQQQGLLNGSQGAEVVDVQKKQLRPEYQLESGATYTGEWIGSDRHGHGVQVWPDGARFEGQWEANKVKGHGKFTHADSDVYEGQWQEGKAHGN